MIDFHSHILPEMDDGSRSSDESIAMIKELAKQGIETVVATPHFYPNNESVSEFLERRMESYKRLTDKSEYDFPEIKLGAEVKFYDGISRLSNFEDLCIEGTKLILLEMPFCKWTEYTVRELIDITCSGKVILVLAHIERYLKFQNRNVIDKLIQNGVLIQINAGFLNGRFTKYRAIKMLKHNKIHFIGSDCHNMADRSPDIGKAYSTIRKKLGDVFLSEIIDFGNYLLK